MTLKLRLFKLYIICWCSMIPYPKYHLNSDPLADGNQPQASQNLANAYNKLNNNQQNIIDADQSVNEHQSIVLESCQSSGVFSLANHMNDHNLQSDSSCYIQNLADDINQPVIIEQEVPEVMSRTKQELRGEDQPLEKQQVMKQKSQQFTFSQNCILDIDEDMKKQQEGQAQIIKSMIFDSESSEHSLAEQHNIKGVSFIKKPNEKGEVIQRNYQKSLASQQVKNSYFNQIKIDENLKLIHKWNRTEHLQYVAFMEILNQKMLKKEPVHEKTFLHDLKTYIFKKQDQRFKINHPSMMKNRLASTFDGSLVALKQIYQMKIQQIITQKQKIRNYLLNENKQSFEKLTPDMNDLGFQQIQTSVQLKLNNEETLKSYKTRYAILRTQKKKQKNIEQKIKKKQRWDFSTIIEASFSFPHTLLNQMSQQIGQTINGSHQQTQCQKTDFSNNECTYYPFKVYLILPFRAQYEYKKAVPQNKPSQKDKDIKKLCPRNLDYSHQKLYKSYLQFLTISKEKIKQSQQKSLKKPFYVQMAKHIFESINSEDLKDDFQDIKKDYYKEVKNYHQNNMKTYESFDNIINKTIPKKLKQLDSSTNIANWKTFLRQFTIQNMSPQVIVQESKSTAIKLWNQLKRLEMISLSPSVKNMQNCLSFSFSQSVGSKQDPKHEKQNKVENQIIIEEPSNHYNQENSSSQTDSKTSKREREEKENKSQIVDFQFNQNLLECGLLNNFALKLEKKEKSQKQKKTKTWIERENLKSLAFLILYYKKMYKNGKIKNGIPLFLSKTIGTKTLPQCQDYLTIISAYQTKQGAVKKSLKEIIEDLIDKNKIEEDEIVSEIGNQIKFEKSHFFFDYSIKKLSPITIRKEKLSSIDQPLIQYLSQQKIMINFAA